MPIPAGLKSKGWALVAQYGTPVKFAAKMVLDTLLPGAPVVDLALMVLEYAQELGKKEPSGHLPGATDADFKKVEGLFDILSTDMQSVMMQLAQLHDTPDLARKTLHAALETDRRCEDAFRNIYRLFGDTQEQNHAIIQAQQAANAKLAVIDERLTSVVAFIEELRASGVSGTAFRDLVDAYSRGKLRLANGQPRAAGQEFDDVAVKRPQSWVVAEDKARTQIAVGDLPGAQQSIKRAARLNPQDVHLQEADKRLTRLVSPPTSPAAQAFLVVTGKTPDVGKRYVLAEDRTILGRSRECHVVITSPEVSREHACIVRRDGRFYIEDHSRSGTLLNDQHISRTTLLKNNDCITICDQSWTFRDSATARLQVAPEEPTRLVVQPAQHAQQSPFFTASTNSTQLTVQCVMHRNGIAITGNSAVAYGLVKLLPAANAHGGRALGLNLALVLDVSGSMYEEDGTGVSRLKRVQKAARGALDMLKAGDTMAVVGFAYNAQLILPSTQISDKAKIMDVIDKIDMFDVDPGGNSMDQGIQLAMDELAWRTGPDRMSQIVIITCAEDAECLPLMSNNINEAICRQLALMAFRKNIHMTLVAIGPEWNSALIKDLAKLSEGRWFHIDVNRAKDAERILETEFKRLTNVGLINVEMCMRPTRDVELKRVRQVVPEIAQLSLAQPEPRVYVVRLGSLESNRVTKYVFELKLPKRPDGRYVIAQLEVSFDSRTGVRETASVPIQATYTSGGHPDANSEVTQQISKIQLFELADDLHKAVASSNMNQVVKITRAIEQKGKQMGRVADQVVRCAEDIMADTLASRSVVASLATELAATVQKLAQEDGPVLATDGSR